MLELNPIEHCNCIVLRSGEHLEGPQVLELRRMVRRTMLRVIKLFLVRMNPKRRIIARGLRHLRPLS